MGRLEFATPRQAWGGEASRFTPLLGHDEMLQYLGDATGIGPLSVVEVEFATAGNRSLDILAETPDGRRVAIENQYGEGDHDHLTRGLAYAVATDAAALVVIAENHRDEFVSVADYLNEVGGQVSHGIRVWLVQVRAVRRVGDAVWSPEFVVQAEPNEWEAAVRKDVAPVLSSLEEFYQRCEEQSGATWAEATRTMIEDWLSRPGANEFHGNQTTVSLYYPSPAHGPTGVNVIQMSTRGTFYVCRGYIWTSSGVYDPSQPPNELDDQIRHHFPDAIWTGKQVFIRVPDPQPSAVSSFVDWLTDRFTVASANRS